MPGDLRLRLGFLGEGLRSFQDEASGLRAPGKGRQGVDFMEICKKKQIHNFCTPNALMTLAEYLSNYASNEGENSTKVVGDRLLKAEIAQLPEAMRKVVQARLEKAMAGDVRFI